MDSEKEQHPSKSSRYNAAVKPRNFLCLPDDACKGRSKGRLERNEVLRSWSTLRHAETGDTTAQPHDTQVCYSNIDAEDISVEPSVVYRTREVHPIRTNYFSSAATRSACCSAPARVPCPVRAGSLTAGPGFSVRFLGSGDVIAASDGGDFDDSFRRHEAAAQYAEPTRRHAR